MDIELAAYFVKVLLMFLGVCLVYRSASSTSKTYYLPSGIMAIGIVFFMCGVEFMAPNDNSWSYWLFQAGRDEYSKALFGGALMLFLPVFLYAFVGKNVSDLIDVTHPENGKSNNQVSSDE